jgi:DNA-3-methyladenine glycosylase II
MTATSLTRATLPDAVAELVAADADLAGIVERHGPPPLWARRPGFATLVKMILEQQVSLASADAAYRRLVRRLGRVTPGRFLELDGRTLHSVGFSRQKAGYCRDLAAAVLDRRLNLRKLPHHDDDAVRAMLIEHRGIGPWTADVFLLMALGRPDIWPIGDVALITSAQRVKRLRSRPDDEKLDRIARRWRPWRSVAARLLWHDYLQRRRS